MKSSIKRRNISKKNITRNKSKGINLLKIVILTFITVLIIYTALSYIFSYTSIVGLKFKTVVNDDSYIMTEKDPEINKTIFIVENNEHEIEHAIVLVYNNEKAEMIEIDIPQGVYMSDYSTIFEETISVKNLIYVGGTINQDRKYEYALWQIQNLTGIRINSYVIINKDTIDILISEGCIENYKNYLTESFEKFNVFKCISNSETINEYLSKTYSSLSAEELGSLLNKYKNTNIENNLKIDLNDSNYTTDSVDSTGNILRIVNLYALDEKISEKISLVQTKEQEKELVRVEIYNGSGVNKAGERYSRRVKNEGCKVLRVGNSPKQIELTTVYINNPEKYPESLDVVMSLFLTVPEVKYERPDFMTTGDIIIILGEDLVEEVDWK